MAPGTYRISLRRGLLAMALTCLAATASAAPITFFASVDDVNGPINRTGFPINFGVVGAFTFSRADVTSATISGTWGTAAFSDSSAATDVFLDGILVASCRTTDFCFRAGTGLIAWAYTFSVAELATGFLDDGFAELSVVQNSQSQVRVGNINLFGEADRMDVAEPASVSLLALAALGLFGRQQRSRKATR